MGSQQARVKTNIKYAADCAWGFGGAEIVNHERKPLSQELKVDGSLKRLINETV